MQINFPAINNQQVFLEMRVLNSLTITCRSGMQIRHRSVRDCNIKRTMFKYEKVNNTILQEFRKDCNTSMKQEHGERMNKKEKTTLFLMHHSTVVYDVKILSESVGIQ